MEYLGVILSLVFVFGGAIALIVWAVRYEAKFKKIYAEKFNKGLDFIKDELNKANFTVSRQLGYYKYGNASFYFYVDDVNKKWVFASPVHGEIDKIRDFSDLLEWDFFDKDSTESIVKFLQASNTVIMSGSGLVIGTVAGAGMGAVLGGKKASLFGGAAGGVGGAVAGSKLVQAFGMNDITGSYGIVLRTADTEAMADANNPNPRLVFDFVSTYDKNLGKDRSKYKGLKRNAIVYEADIEEIKKMAEVLDYIIQSNR